jgi:preprotein translocase subunit SecA
LITSDLIEKKDNGDYLLKDKSNEKYFLQPHCIQILGILMLLDVHKGAESIPSNHLAEILTGQGKSWALALLAGYVSLTGYEVTVACYRDYLSRRDKDDFNKDSYCFQFENKVTDRTFQSMCNEKLIN